MEIRFFFMLLRERYKLVLILTGAGLILALLLGFIQKPIYESTTKVLFNRVRQEQFAGLVYQNDAQLVQTYTEMLSSNVVQSAAATRLGYAFSSKAVKATPLGDAQIIQVTVSQSKPERAAEIANMLVEILIEQNQELYVRRYDSMEQSLKTQIDDVQAQIADLRSKSELAQQQEVNAQLAQVNEEIRLLEEELTQLRKDIAALPVALNAADRNTLAEKQARVAQLEPLLAQYQQLQTNLLILGKPSTSAGGDQMSISEQYQTTINQYQEIYLTLLNNLESVQLARSQGVPDIVPIQKAEVPDHPVRPRRLLYVMVGGFLGFALGVGSVFLKGNFDESLSSPLEVEQALKFPVLASIPFSGLLNGSGKASTKAGSPEEVIDESLRSVLMQLMDAAKAKPIQVLLITSLSEGEGKTTLAFQLSQKLAALGKKVVLVDGNLRRPRMQEVVNAKSNRSLGEILTEGLGRSKLNKPVSDIPGLSVITGGGYSKAGLDAPERMSHVLDRLRKLEDWIIVDSAPLFISDTQALVGMADAVLLVMQPGVNRPDVAEAAVEPLKRKGIRLVGVVLNNISQLQMEMNGFYAPRAYQAEVKEDERPVLETEFWEKATDEETKETNSGK